MCFNLIEMKKYSTCYNILFALSLIVGVALFVYGLNGFFKDGYTLTNILKSAAGFLAIISLSYKIYRDSKEDNSKNNNKKEEIYRQLAVKYEAYSKIKLHINDNLDRNGNLKEEPFRNSNNRPTKVEVEDFMRFFKDLKWEIQCGNLDWDTAKKKFSKYALLVHQHEYFRSNITDYYSSDWQDFRDYCEHILHMY